MVTIPDALRRKLNPLGPHFCLVRKHDKDPSVGGRGWQKPENLLQADNPKLQRHLANGGNYGVVGGFGLVILDADTVAIKELIQQFLPETFTVESPGSHGWHCYYLCGLEKPIRLRDENKDNVGDIQGPGKMVVGPNSIHPNGGRYKIVKDAPFASVTKQQLVEALKTYVIPEKEFHRVEYEAKQEKTKFNVDLSIMQVVPLAGLHRRGHEYFGPHPIHGSKNGRNFHVDTKKNVWYCFRHSTGGGPLSWLAVQEGIINCENAVSGALRGPLFKQVLQKAVERGLIKDVKLQKQAKQNLEPIILDHLNLIENPDLTGKPVIVEAVVSSTSTAYLAPSEVEANRVDQDGNTIHVEEKIGLKDPLNLKLIGVSGRSKQYVLRGLLALKNDEYVKEMAWRSVYQIRVRPPVFTLEKRGEKIVDERGYEYKAFDIYVIANKPLDFEPSSIIRVEGLPLPNPKTQKITFLAYKVEFPEEVHSFDVHSLNQLKQKFQGFTVNERVDWILDNFEAYSQIVERRNLAKTSLLDFFTPTWVKFNGDIQKGWGDMLLIGDTTTAKSETIRKSIRLLKAGMLITAETASTVGLTGTTTQIEGGNWFVDWGFLVLLDKKLLAVDGAHKLSLSNWSVLAEAERSGVVAIAKAAKDKAYARTRQIKIANPVDRDGGKYNTKSLANFLYPCQALPTILDKTSIARLDLCAFADQRDVEAKKINKTFDGNFDPLLHCLSEALKWCWSNLAEVKFTREAVSTLLELATKIHNQFFCEMIPLASIDLKWKLARLSVALAYLTLSTEDYSRVTVTKEHVEAVSEFMKDEYSKAGLNTLAQETKFEKLQEDDVKLIIKKVIEATDGSLNLTSVKNILKFIVMRGRFTKEQLKTKFSLSNHSQLRPLLAVFSNEKLIKVGRGFYPTSKLIEAYKLLDTIDTIDTPKLEGGSKAGQEKLQ